MVTDADIAIEPGLNFRQLVIKHSEIMQKIYASWIENEEKRKKAVQSDSLSEFKAVALETSELQKYSAPYLVAQKQAEVLAASGWILTNWEGQVCNAGNCTNVDPMTAVFMIAAKALADELRKDRPFDPETNDLIKFIMQPAGGDGSAFVHFRSLFIPQDDQGEIAKLLRDPIKRPVEIIQTWRDAIIPADDNGEIAKFIRDPIKCSIGHLWGACD